MFSVSFLCCRIFLGGIIAEGNDRGHIEIHPTPYNVVLEDTTYKGEIKIGLNFRVNVRNSHKRVGVNGENFTSEHVWEAI